MLRRKKKTKKNSRIRDGMRSGRQQPLHEGGRISCRFESMNPGLHLSIWDAAAAAGFPPSFSCCSQAQAH